MLDGALGLIIDFFKVLLSTVGDTIKTFLSLLPKVINEFRRMRK